MKTMYKTLLMAQSFQAMVPACSRPEFVSPAQTLKIKETRVMRALPDPFPVHLPAIVSIG